MKRTPLNELVTLWYRNSPDWSPPVPVDLEHECDEFLADESIFDPTERYPRHEVRIAIAAFWSSVDCEPPQNREFPEEV